MESSILLGAITVLLLFNYFYIRILWLKHFSMIILQRSPPMFTHLPPFKYMLYKRFWVWDEVKFLPNIDDLRME